MQMAGIGTDGSRLIELRIHPVEGGDRGPRSDAAVPLT